MPTTTDSPQAELQIFSLKIKPSEPSDASTIQADTTSIAEMVAPPPKLSDTENSYTANVDILGKSNVAIAGTVLDTGYHLASTSLAASDFTFDMLFNNFSSELSQFFVFDDVTVHLTQKPGDTAANSVEFSGRLRMDSGMLASFKNFLKLDTGIAMTATIDTGGQDLSNKIIPTGFTLGSTADLHVQIAEGVTLSAATLKVAIQKQTDAVSSQVKWFFLPTVSGTLTFSNFGSTSINMTAEISYSNKALHVGASVSKISGLFGVSSLSLDEVSISFDAGNESSMDLTAKLSAGFSTLNFQGKLTPQYGAMIASAKDFTVNNLNDLFRSISSNKTLSLPEFDVVFDKVTIGLATKEATVGSYQLEKGFTLGCSVSIHGHTCDATAVISPEGVLIEGALGEVAFGPVSIKQAKLRMQFYSTASSKPSAFGVYGSAVIQGVSVDCKVAYEKLGNTWNAVVYGGLSSNSFGLSNLFPAAAGSMLDTLKFSKVAFIFASQDSTTQDPDFSLPVKKGLQLTGTLEDIPALSKLTKTSQVGLQLTALLGTTTSISIAMPDTRLNLGRNITTDPLSIAIQITPQPELDLIFGLNVNVPNQTAPLHFDLKLGIGVTGANGSGTMKGYWKDPFGVHGLQIGPELALQLDIIYAQFLSSGTPSGFGFVGGIMLGDIVGKMAVSIQEDPTKEVLYGEIDALSPRNLVKFASTITGLQLQDSAIPDFFQLKQLKLYCAPAGGMIGTVTFEKGFSFAGDLVLLGKEVAVYASFNANGVVIKGHLDHMEIGPLKIKGEQGKDAALNLELTTATQSVLIDGAIDFMGSHVGLYVNISKSGIEFKFDENFAELLKYTVTGKSEGSISNPAGMDFMLTSEFDNSITAYLKNKVSQKIKDALKATNMSIEVAQADLARKEAAYKALFDPANATLIKAQADADAAIANARQSVEVEKQKWAASIQDAQNKLTAAKLGYDTAFANATKAVADAQAKYNNSMKSAQDAVTNAQRTYDTALNNAQNAVNTAKANYDNKFRSAYNTLNDAQNKVNDLQNQINDLNNKINHASGFDKLKIPGWKIAIGGVEAAKGIANGVLAAAKKVVEGFASTSEAIAFNTATIALNVVKTTGEYAALQTAQKVLQGVQYGVDYTAFQAAQQTLAGIQYSSQYTVWMGAQKTLEAAQTTGRAALTQAESALTNIGGSLAYTTLELARKSLDAIKTGSAAFAYQQAQAYLQAAKLGSAALLNLSSYIASHAGDFIDVRKVKLSARLKDIEKGNLFSSNIDIAVLGKSYNWTFDFNVQDAASFIQSLFSKAFDEAKKIVGG